MKKARYGRYGFALLFSAGFVSILVILAASVSDFAPSEEIWLSAALLIVLMLHARMGFVLNRTRSELELVQRLSDNVATQPKDLPAPRFAPLTSGRVSDDMTQEDTLALSRVRDAIMDERIELYLQPIVSLPQRKARFYEAFSRLRDENNKLLLPSEYIEAAEKANRISVIDNMILVRCIQALRQRRETDPRIVVFCNLSPATIFDREFFSEFTEYLEANDDLAPNLVFEFTYPAIHMLHPRAERNLDALAKKGFAFSIDHVHGVDLDWDQLKRRNFRYLKASSKMLLSYARGGEDDIQELGRFRRRLTDLGIDLIAEKIEFENHMPEIIALGLDYGQGNLFGPARRAGFYLDRIEDDTAAEAGRASPANTPAELKLAV
ncbi:MAG: EAL domain-containing protein [Pseudomonadota bacterium]